jgi:hypothetical protein
MRNGDIYKGIIVEIVPNDYIRIETKDGSIRMFKYAEITKMTKEINNAQESSSNDFNKTMQYESQKKSNTTAVVLGLLLPSTI